VLAHVHSATIVGIDAIPVAVEVDIKSKGLPGWNMVGLLETTVKEARDRVTSAISNAGFVIPNRKTIINLSPANLKKKGTHFDLPIAVALLAASGSIREDNAKKYMIVGELSLTGRVCATNGVLIMGMTAVQMGLCGLIVPAQNAWEAKLSNAKEIIEVETLFEVANFLNEGIVPQSRKIRHNVKTCQNVADFGEVKGQEFAKRGLEIAAAGGHNIALSGPPGTGKTMLAERLPSILPDLTNSEATEVLKIRSWHGLLREFHEIPRTRPFRAPHHSASFAGLLGGGSSGSPNIGEISLAHRGVLFLDEIAEFNRDVIEVLRQPMESGAVRIVRSGLCVTYPARFMLVCAYNPCRCGYLTHPKKACTCSVAEIRRYHAKLSGPLMDRIDLHVEVGPPAHSALLSFSKKEESMQIKSRILAARRIQTIRYGNAEALNAVLSAKEISELLVLDSKQESFLRNAASKLDLSGRAVHKMIKLSRTIADLANSEGIKEEHIAEALQFRRKDQEF